MLAAETATANERMSKREIKIRKRIKSTIKRKIRIQTGVNGRCKSYS
jgi:hypothetical protein